MTPQVADQALLSVEYEIRRWATDDRIPASDRRRLRARLHRIEGFRAALGLAAKHAA
jgi:hypothetical protein